MDITGRERSRVRRWLRLLTPPIIVMWKRQFSATRNEPELDVLGQTGQSLSPPRINLCCGPIRLAGYLNIDVDPAADFVLDLETSLLPFPEASAEVVVCMSGINYFSRDRAQQIIRDVHRVLRPRGVVRFGVQDLRVLAEKYLLEDREFFGDRLTTGALRFPGETLADKMNEWFYGYGNGFGNFVKYVYDFETLQLLFRRAGFVEIKKKRYRESAIPGIETIDNRPEQMFYVEACKGDADYFWENGVALWKGGRKEQGWQYILHALDLNGGHESAVRFALEVVRRGRRPADTLKLLDQHGKAALNDPELNKIQVEVSAELNSGTLDSAASAARRRELDGLNARRNPVQSDQEHLHECMNWLKRAQTAGGDNGVSLQFDLVQRRWDISFPETTGYVIPTFLCYGKLVGKPEYGHIAEAMGDWEIAIQAVTGGAGEPVGWFHHPRVFNTGQVLLGWIALFHSTHEARYLRAAHDAAHFILQHLDEAGRWVRYTFLNAPRAYKVRVAWALLELFALTRYTPYRRAAEKAIKWVLTQSCDNGWFHSNSISHDNRVAITHSVAYTLVGLLETYRLHNASCDYGRVLEVLRAAADNLTRVYLRDRESTIKRGYRGLPARFDAKWRASNQWSCVTGNLQIEFFLRRLRRYVDNPDYLTVANALLDEMKTLHLVDGITDENMRGGVCGSDPIGGAYCPYAIPNWGVKFFADSLLQKILPPREQPYLG